MKVAAILRDLSSTFLEDFAAMAPGEKLAWCIGDSGRASGVTVKVGSGSFRDAVEWNALMRGPHRLSCSVENRRGYKLATFITLPGATR